MSQERSNMKLGIGCAISACEEMVTAMTLRTKETVTKFTERAAGFSPKKTTRCALKPAGIIFLKAIDPLIVNPFTIRAIEWVSERRRKKR